MMMIRPFVTMHVALYLIYLTLALEQSALAQSYASALTRR